MASSWITRFSSCFQNMKSTTQRRFKTTWYRWLQLLVGTIGFMCFIFYGSYNAPKYDFPIILGCYVISGVSLINSMLAFIKLRKAYNKKKRNITSGEIELKLEQNSAEATENNNNNVPESPVTHEEVENLRKMLRQVLDGHNLPHKTDETFRPPTYQQAKHHVTQGPYSPREKWTNPHWDVNKIPSGGNRLRRTESYESSLKFHQGYNRKRIPSLHRSSAQAEACCPSSSDRDTYIYSSSSDGNISTGWKRNFIYSSRKSHGIANPNPQDITHRKKNVEQFEMDRTRFDECPPRLTKDLPSQFPALPFPQRNNDIERYKHRHIQDSKKFKLRVEKFPPATSLTKSTSMIDIDRYEHMTKKDILKILANISPPIVSSTSTMPKPSNKKHNKKKHVPKNINIQRV